MRFWGNLPLSMVCQEIELEITGGNRLRAERSNGEEAMHRLESRRGKAINHATRMLGPGCGEAPPDWRR